MTLAAAAPPLTERLRALVVNQASEATLTCAFVPGGKFGGVGIRSHLYCAHCSQGLIWHEVAAGLVLIATAEQIVQAASDLEQIRLRLAGIVADHEHASQILDDCRAILSSSGVGRGGSAV